MTTHGHDRAAPPTSRRHSIRTTLILRGQRKFAGGATFASWTPTKICVPGREAR
jgi:hypothetical protein